MRLLVTSASRKIALLSAIEAQLRELEPRSLVLAGDRDPNCLAAFAWHDFTTLPDDDDPALAETVARLGVTHVLPTRDTELAMWSRLAPSLAASGVSVLVSAAEGIDACADKLRFAGLLTDAGVPTPRTALSLDALGSSQETRFVVKERRGAGSRGARTALPAHEVDAALDSLREPIVQEHVSGTELSVDAFISASGELLGAVARTRDVVVAGESWVTTTVDAAPYLDYVAAVARATGVTGHVVIQVIDAGMPQVIECNARLGGASSFALALGLPTIPWWLGREADFAGVGIGSRMVRWAQDHVIRHSP